MRASKACLQFIVENHVKDLPKVLHRKINAYSLHLHSHHPLVCIHFASYPKIFSLTENILYKIEAYFKAFPSSQNENVQCHEQEYVGYSVSPYPVSGKEIASIQIRSILD